MGGSARAGSGQGAGVIDQAKEKAQQLANQAQQQAGQKVESGLHRGKAQAAETLGGVAQSLRQSSQQLRDRNQGAGQYVERAAQQTQRLSEYLQNTDVNQIIDRAEDAARRQPALFLGGAFALGLLGARFLKSSRRGEGQQAVGAGYSGAPRYAGETYGRTGTGISETGTSGRGYRGERDVTGLRDVTTEGRTQRDVASSGAASPAEGARPAQGGYGTSPGQAGAGPGTSSAPDEAASGSPDDAERR
jgi:hypothetical protein